MFWIGRHCPHGHVSAETEEVGELILETERQMERGEGWPCESAIWLRTNGIEACWVLGKGGWWFVQKKKSGTHFLISFYLIVKVYYLFLYIMHDKQHIVIYF